MRASLTFLGTGTSVGIPMLACECPACTSPDPRDTRFRSSVLVEWDDHVLVIDTTPEFRLQLLRENIKHLDAILFTHNHADHVSGLDDIRPFCFHHGPIPLYGSPQTMDWIRKRFDYIWEAIQQGGGLPRVTLHPVESPFDVLGLSVTPLPVMHGKLPIYGYRIGDCAYISDVSAIPESTVPLLENLGTLILDAVRYTRHDTHFHVDEAIAIAQQIGAKQTWLTHMNHEIKHAELLGECPPGVAPAYDGLRIEINLD